MRTYKDYYKLAKEHEERWHNSQKDEWWKELDREDEFNTTGVYSDFTEMISIDAKLNSSIGSNHTNVKNKEWSILFSMLGQALIDWCIENNETSVYSYGISIDRDFNYTADTFILSHRLKVIAEDGYWKKVDESSESFKHFKKCDEFLCDIIVRFIDTHKRDIPLEWNHFGFGLDCLNVSCKYGEWTCDSDGSMSLGYLCDTDYNQLVSCL